MINLTAMFWAILRLAITFGLVGLALLPQTPPPLIISPTPGAVLRGQVVIRASLPPGELQRYELDFSYQDDPTQTWFPLTQSDQRPADEALFTWDTTAITDGNYRLRLRVLLGDGQVIEHIVTELRVRNYTAVETETPRESSEHTPTPTPLPATPTPLLTPTPFPPNPLILTPNAILRVLARGGLVALGLLALIGLYSGLRQHRDRS
ncbi:MAG: hypothetical protein ACPLUL_06480 [Thermanaerothrix sp.]|uniref:hypothetical protein n=1 Tax=Thermanaerothrix sp. TaxID=2972675 RepID=UPI003C7A2685